MKGQTVSSSYKPAVLDNGLISRSHHLLKLMTNRDRYQNFRVYKKFNFMNSISANLNVMIKASEKASKILIKRFWEIEKLQVSKKRSN